MLRPRIIPCLLVHDKGLVKTVNFKNAKYVGDPLNAVKIFNEKEVDELVVLDIDATVKNTEPDYQMIASLAVECRMPLCYGGGVKTVEQAIKIIRMGVEKIALSSAALENPSLIKQLSAVIGKQSVVVIIDVKKKLLGGYEIFTHNGTRKFKGDLFEIIRSFEQLGAGEIIVNSIDKDGTMSGYDLTLAQKVRDTANGPVTIAGGAGSLDHLKQLISMFGVIGACAGSLFVFKGVYKAVLINYPGKEEKQALLSGISP